MPAPTQAILPVGTIVQYNNGSSFVEAIEPIDIGNLGNVGTFVDATNLASQNRTREYIPGLNDTEETTLTFHRVKGNADQEALMDRAQAQTKTDFQVTFPDGEIISFSMALTTWRFEGVQPDQTHRVGIQGRVTGQTTRS